MPPLLLLPHNTQKLPLTAVAIRLTSIFAESLLMSLCGAISPSFSVAGSSVSSLDASCGLFSSLQRVMA